MQDRIVLAGECENCGKSLKWGDPMGRTIDDVLLCGECGEALSKPDYSQTSLGAGGLGSDFEGGE
jgi:hypothetical protein